MFFKSVLVQSKQENEFWSEWEYKEFSFLLFSPLADKTTECSNNNFRYFTILHLQNLLYTIYSVEGEWEYFFAPFRKGVKSFKKGLRMKFGYLEGQFIDFMEDSGG